MGRGTQRPIGNRQKPHISLTDLLFCFWFVCMKQKKKKGGGGKLIIKLVNSTLSIFFVVKS